MRLTAFAIALCLAVAGPAAAQQDQDQPPRRITVTGVAEAEAVPDIATLTAGVETRADTAAAALAANSEAMTAVFAALEAAGVTVGAGALAGSLAEVDVRGVTRAVTNLLRNAVQHTPRGGRVEVRTRVLGERVEVAVADGCGGIPEDDLPKLFEPGWRGDASRAGRGMGLGLAIAGEVARTHGGEARVENRADGTGCVATLSLPTTPHPAPPV